MTGFLLCLGCIVKETSTTTKKSKREYTDPPAAPATLCWEENSVLRFLLLFLNNKVLAGIKHPLPGCSDLEEPDQTGGCQTDQAFFPAAGSFPTTAGMAETLASLQHLNWPDQFAEALLRETDQYCSFP